jgi:pimeloyl-ACP methyl ester carboxylesterase
MPKAFVNGINIHYVQTGRGSDLVLIHGIASNLGQWQLNILPRLVEDFRVTMYDLRGHGYSDMPPSGYTANHMVGDFAGLMDYLGIERASILGHSYGGKEALRRQGIEVPGEKAHDLVYLIGQTLKLRGRNWRGMGVQRALARLSRLSATTSFGKEYRENLGLTLEMIRQIHTPALLIYGDRSPLLASFQALRDNLPHCGTAIIADGGHFYPLVHPETFVRHIRGFLQDQRVT